MASVSNMNSPSVNFHQCAGGCLYIRIKNNSDKKVEAAWEDNKLYFSFEERRHPVPEAIGDYRIVFRSGHGSIIIPIAKNEPCSPRDLHQCNGAKLPSFFAE